MNLRLNYAFGEVENLNYFIVKFISESISSNGSSFPQGIETFCNRILLSF